MREAADQRTAVKRLEFVELATVDQPGDDLVDVVRRADIVGDDGVELFGGVFGRARVLEVDVGFVRTMVSACSSFSAR